MSPWIDHRGKGLVSRPNLVKDFALGLPIVFTGNKRQIETIRGHFLRDVYEQVLDRPARVIYGASDPATKTMIVKSLRLAGYEAEGMDHVDHLVNLVCESLRTPSGDMRLADVVMIEPTDLGMDRGGNEAFVKAEQMLRLYGQRVPDSVPEIVFYTAATSYEISRWIDLMNIGTNPCLVVEQGTHRSAVTKVINDAAMRRVRALARKETTTYADTSRI